jgi:hypothetical protein
MSPQGDTNEIDNRPTGGQLDSSMPTRYSNIHLSSTWYDSASGKRAKTKESEEKRKHRKSHGKISFQQLSQKVSSRWSNLEETDPGTKLYCVKIANRELQLYKQKVKMYKASLTADDQRIRANGSFGSSSTSSIISPETASHARHPSSSSILSIHSPTAAATTPACTCQPASFEVSSEFHPSWMTTKLNLAKRTLGEAEECSKRESLAEKVSSAKRKAEESTSTKTAEFSFSPLPPLPPSLQEQEDSFLTNIQKKHRLSPNVSEYFISRDEG